jgi:hypothetical protein
MLKTKYLVLSILYVIITSLSSLSIFGFVIVIFQILLLIFLILYKSKLAVPYLILSFGSSLEFGTFINDGQSPLYNLSNIKLFGLNLGIWMFIMVIPTIIGKILDLRKNISFNRWQYIIFLWFFIMLFISIFYSVFDYIFGASGLSNFNIGYLISLSYLQLWPFFCLFLCITYIKIYNNGLLNLKLTIFYTMTSVIVASFIINSFGIRGTYGSSKYYFSPTLIFLAPLFLVLLKDKFFQISRIKAIIFFFIFIVLPIIFYDFAGGKIIIFSLIALLLFSKRFNFRNLFLAFSLVTLVFIVIYNSVGDGSLLKSKVNEVSSLFNFFSGYWYELLEPSTRFRVDEFILTGFGIVAGAPDYINGYGLVPNGTFPNVEYDFNYFISYHEITSFLIKYGLSGILLLLLIFTKAIKFKETSPFLLVGVIWLILFWGYSFTLAIAGSTILVIGIMELPTKKVKF